MNHLIVNFGNLLFLCGTVVHPFLDLLEKLEETYKIQAVLHTRNRFDFLLTSCFAVEKVAISPHLLYSMAQKFEKCNSIL